MLNEGNRDYSPVILKYGVEPVSSRAPAASLKSRDFVL